MMCYTEKAVNKYPIIWYSINNKTTKGKKNEEQKRIQKLD